MSEHDGTGKRLKVKPYQGAAAGVGAIWHTLKHTYEQTGLWRGTKLLMQVNQTDGFDCPGCAWPDPAHRTLTEFCENGAKAVAEEATRHRVDPAFFAEHDIETLSGWSDMALGKAGRITHPMVKEPGATHYTPVAWEEAFTRIGEALRALDSPHEAMFYTSGRTSNEAAFLYQLFVRALGTNNLPDCSNMCHESSGMGLTPVIGIGKGTVTLEDFDHADAIFVIGQNPGTNHPRMLSSLQAAARRGAKIVTINPLKEPALVRFKHPQEVTKLVGSGTAISSHYAQVRVGGDAALLKGIAKAVLEAEAAQPGQVLDREFIATFTEGFEAYQQTVEGTPWADIIADSGVDQETIDTLAGVYMSAERVILCWAMGLTQHTHGVINVQECVNLLLLRGNLGKPGAGACPVRGHSNVQGDRTVGIWDRPSEAFLTRLDAAVGFTSPRQHGANVVEAIEAMSTGAAKAFFAMGGNLVSAAPDTELTAAAIARCELTVHVSTKLNRSHTTAGETSFILPCLGRTERDVHGDVSRFVTVENSMGVVHPSQGRLQPASEHLLSEPEIVARLAEATLGEQHVTPWRRLGEDYDALRDLMSRALAGFDDYNARVRQEGGFSLPNGARERVFKTASGKAHFSCHPLPEIDVPEGQLVMMTVRSHDQYNTTIYGLDDRYRGVYGDRRVAFMHEADMAERGIAAQDLVTLTSHFNGQRRQVSRFTALPFEMPRGTVVTYFPEANPLVPLGRHADISHTPTSKFIPITVEPFSAD